MKRTSMSNALCIWFAALLVFMPWGARAHAHDKAMQTAPAFGKEIAPDQTGGKPGADEILEEIEDEEEEREEQMQTEHHHNYHEPKIKGAHGVRPDDDEREDDDEGGSGGD